MAVMVKKPASRVRDAVTAYREAGHAVVSWFLSIGLRRASIIPDADDNSSGHVLNRAWNKRDVSEVELSGDRFNPNRLRAEKRVMVYMAGELAQRRFNPRSLRSHHASHDREFISIILEKYGSLVGNVVDITQHYKLLRQWTAELLESRWYLVEAVADALLKHGTLSSLDPPEHHFGESHGIRKPGK